MIVAGLQPDDRLPGCRQTNEFVRPCVQTRHTESLVWHLSLCVVHLLCVDESGPFRMSAAAIGDEAKRLAHLPPYTAAKLIPAIVCRLGLAEEVLNARTLMLAYPLP